MDTPDKTVIEWSRLAGIHKATIAGRLNAGWPDEDAVTIQPRGA